MINLDLDKKSSIPLYVQIFEQISDKVNNGVLKSGTKLPSQRELSSKLGISVNTVVNAYNMLMQYDYITAESKSGYYVNKNNQAEIVFTEQSWQSNNPLKYNFSKNGVNLKMNNGFKKTIRQIAKMITDRDFSYPDYIGEYELRKQICLMLGKYYEIDCQPTQIIVGASINYLLELLIKVIGSDKVYGFENPYYYKINDWLRLSKYKTTYVNIDINGISRKELQDFYADVLFLMPYHHYPISSTLSLEQKADVLEWAKKDKYIIEYGFDMEFVYSPSSKPMFSMAENKNVIFMNDFSRTISPSLNIAYLILPDSLVKRWKTLYLNFHSCTSKFEQMFISESIKNGSYYQNIKRLKRDYNTKRHTLISAIENHSMGKYIEVKNSKAGTFLIIEVKANCKGEKLLEEAHKAGVKLSYISNYFEKHNDLISPTTFVLGYGELTQAEICAGINLLLDTWEKLIDKAKK